MFLFRVRVPVPVPVSVPVSIYFPIYVPVSVPVSVSFYVSVSVTFLFLFLFFLFLFPRQTAKKVFAGGDRQAGRPQGARTAKCGQYKKYADYFGGDSRETFWFFLGGGGLVGPKT